jgi:hypothetical protein
VKPFAFGRRSATIQDRFATGPATLTSPNRVCAPSSKQVGTNPPEDPTAASDPNHLMSFPSLGNSTRLNNQTVVNQFGTLKLDVIRRSFLFVPTAKDLNVPPQPLTNPTDHFECYLVRRSTGSARFSKISGITGVDQFGSQAFDILRPRYLCVPANKNNEDPGALSHTDNLLCYKARHRQNFPTLEPHVNNQFLNDQVKLVRRMEFCVPSTIVPLN